MRVVQVRSSSRRWPSALTSATARGRAHDDLLAVDPARHADVARGLVGDLAVQAVALARGADVAQPAGGHQSAAEAAQPVVVAQAPAERPALPTAETQASGTPRYQAPKQSRPRSGSRRASIPSHARRSSARHPPSVRDAVAEQTASRFARPSITLR